MIYCRLENWMGVTGSSKDYLAEVRSPAAVFLRLFAFDEALRFDEVVNFISSQDERAESSCCFDDLS